MKALDAAIHHAKWLNDSWNSARANSQTGEYAHKFDEALKGLLEGFEAEAEAAKPAPAPEKPAPKTEKV